MEEMAEADVGGGDDRLTVMKREMVAAVIKLGGGRR
jgi:hypothetical protein